MGEYENMSEQITTLINNQVIEELCTHLRAPEVNVNQRFNYDGKQGVSMLHVAAIMKRPLSLKAIVSFYANISLHDEEHATALHYAGQRVEKEAGRKDDELKLIMNCVYVLKSVGAKNCPKDKAGCSEECKVDSESKGHECDDIGPVFDMGPLQAFKVFEFNDIANYFRDPSKAGIGALVTCDGGAMRGLFTLAMLHCFEMVLRATTNDNKAKICDMFNYFGGSSIGSIIVLSLAIGKNVTEITKMMWQLRVELLGLEKSDVQVPVPTATMEDIFQKWFGNTRTMADLDEEKRVFVMSSQVDDGPLRLRILSNSSSTPSDSRFAPENTPVWSAAQGSSSIPILFQVNLKGLLDGGVLANNPTNATIGAIISQMDAWLKMGKEEGSENPKISEADQKMAKRSFKEVPSIALSLGCGKSPPQAFDAGDLDILASATTAKFVDGIAKNFGLSLSALTETDGHIVKADKILCSVLPIDLYRLTPGLSVQGSSNGCGTQARKLIQGVFETLVYMHKNSELVHQIVDDLITKKNSRAGKS